jgi:hypothetical protein
MRASGFLVLGLGLGLGAGYLATDRWDSPALVWLGLGLIILSSVLLALSGRRGTVGASEAAGPGERAGVPAAADLGRRVEQILALAEEQAADHIRSAEEEAERIIARARQFPD